MPQRGWLDDNVRAMTAALADARRVLDRAKADAVVANRRWVQTVKDNAHANLARLGEDVAFSQRTSRDAYRAALQPVRPRQISPATPRTPAAKPALVSTPAPRAVQKPDVVERARDAALQVDTAVRGAADTLTFGFADELSAGASAAFDFRRRSFGDKFADYQAAELARDRADASQRPLARGFGQAIGLGVSLMAPSPAAAARMFSPKLLSEMRGLKGIAVGPRIQTKAREYLVTSSGAGLANGAMQSATDIATGGHGSAGDYLAAMIGGTVAAPVAIARSPKSAGAVEGFTTSAAQDLLNGRPISFDNAMRSSAAGGVSGDIADRLGTAWAKGLSSTQKGKLGERLSMYKTRARGHVPNGRGRRLYLSKGYTVLDPASSLDELVESKQGPSVEASANQIRAFLEHPGRYRFDWWQPSDVGKITGFGGSSLGVHLADDDPP